MPNWCEGTLKIRGTRADIIKFLKGSLMPLHAPGAAIKQMLGQEVEIPKVEIDEDDCNFDMKSPNGFYVRGTRRAFIERDIDWWFEDSHEEILILDDFKQAWGLEAEPYVKLSKEYNVDINIYVFEKGMEFNQHIEIHKGVVIKDVEIKFDDYQWECISPNMGG